MIAEASCIVSRPALPTQPKVELTLLGAKTMNIRFSIEKDGKVLCSSTYEIELTRQLEVAIGELRSIQDCKRLAA